MTRFVPSRRWRAARGGLSVLVTTLAFGSAACDRPAWLGRAAPAASERPAPAAMTSVPRSQDGLAAQYPGDVGIERHPDVIFVEQFEAPRLSEIFERWTDVRNGPAMSLAPDVPPGSLGAHSLSIRWAGGGVNNGGHLYRQLQPGLAGTVHVRYYIKYPVRGHYRHAGVWLGGYQPARAWPNPQAGTKASGEERFSAAAEQNTTTERFDHYDYWMGMRQSIDGHYWGNVLLNDPSVRAGAGRWTCVEQMVKLNDPVTASNGEHALWLDDVKVSHLGPGFPRGTWSGGAFTQDPAGQPFEGFRWRTEARLNVNWIWLQNYSPDDPEGFQGEVKFDHLVVARSRIGCLHAGARTVERPR